MREHLLYNKAGSTALIQLNRLEKKNSLNSKLRREMEELLGKLSGDATTRAVILTGGEEIFCAGADISEIQEATSAEAAYRHAREFQLLFDQVEALPQPVIAAISGYALGGGFELALACDFRIAVEKAKLGLPEIKIGAFPGGGGTQRLPRLVGAAKAKEMILFGDPITAEEALSWGLLTRVVLKGKLHDEALALASQLASLPRLALQASKMLINRALEIDLPSGLELEACAFRNLAQTHDLREGVAAFLEKRQPVYTGS